MFSFNPHVNGQVFIPIYPKTTKEFFIAQVTSYHQIFTERSSASDAALQYLKGESLKVGTQEMFGVWGIGSLLNPLFNINLLGFWDFFGGFWLEKLEKFQNIWLVFGKFVVPF